MAEEKKSWRSHDDGKIVANVYRLEKDGVVLFSYDFSGARVKEGGTLIVLLSGSEEEAQRRADHRVRKEYEQVGEVHQCSAEACSAWTAVAN